MLISCKKEDEIDKTLKEASKEVDKLIKEHQNDDDALGEKSIQGLKTNKSERVMPAYNHALLKKLKNAKIDNEGYNEVDDNFKQSYKASYKLTKDLEEKGIIDEIYNLQNDAETMNVSSTPIILTKKNVTTLKNPKPVLRTDDMDQKLPDKNAQSVLSSLKEAPNFSYSIQTGENYTRKQAEIVAQKLKKAYPEAYVVKKKGDFGYFVDVKPASNERRTSQKVLSKLLSQSGVKDLSIVDDI